MSVWPGDRVPSADGFGGIDGECPYCGGQLMWTGWGWSAHSEVYHQAVTVRVPQACTCTHNPALTASLGFPVRCPHCGPSVPVPPDQWVDHIREHHPEETPGA